MADFVLLDGDQVMFIPLFGPAIVTVQPAQMSGSGKLTVGGKPVCVDGDEGGVEVPGCPYITPVYPIPGTGTITIDALGPDQKAQETTTEGKAVLLKGSTFTAKFEVQSPAQQPTASGATVPDSTPQYSGSGSFITTNLKARAT